VAGAERGKGAPAGRAPVTADELARALVRDELRSFPAYSVPHPPGVAIKLDANELPYPLPPDVAAELARELARVELNRYPDAQQAELRAEIAAMLGVAPETLVLGNGSDEIIGLLVTCFARPRSGRARAAVAYPVPSFAVFGGAALAAGCEAVEIALEDDFTLDFARVERSLAASRPNLVFFARPNNPTGTLWPARQVAEVARAHPDVLVVSDEAYAAFAGDSMIGMTEELPNLLVMQTLSKTGLAALRIGYVHAAPALLAEIEKVRMPYNIGSLNQRAAVWILRNCRALLAERCAGVVRERKRLAAALAGMAGVRAFPSQANLILFRVGEPGDGRATAVWEGMCRRGVLVRSFDRPGPLAGCMRVTVGSPEENEGFLAALSDSLADSPASPAG
jgi:histidinol-phosphate aminotransferase